MLAVAKLGAVIMPTTGALGPADLADRIARGGARFVIANAADTAEVRRPRVASRRRLHRASRWASRAGGLARLRRRRRRRVRRTVRPHDRRRRPDADLLHLRHHQQAQAGGAFPDQLPGRAPVDDGVDRAAARRRAPGDQLAGLGQARVELLLRAVDRRGDDLRLQLPPVRRRRADAPDPPCRRQHVLRAADGVADADPDRPGRQTRRAARDSGRGRTAQPRRHRAGGAGVGTDHPRRLRTDRDHAAGRQHPGSTGQGRFDGPADAGCAGRAGRPGDRRARRRGRDLPRPEQDVR